jgi:hypothetical protein
VTTLTRGKKQQFVAHVEGVFRDYISDENKGVDWTVDGGGGQDDVEWGRNADGSLYITPKEGGSATTLTVTATSNLDSSLDSNKSGTATVTVVNPPTEWDVILDALEATRMYGTLDLSNRPMNISNGEFDPGTRSTGKQYILSLVLPDEVTSIKAGSFSKPTFQYFTALKSVSGKKVETVGAYAFRNCSSLETVDLPAAKDIGQGAFSRCFSLATVYLPAAAPTLGKEIFRLIDALPTVTVLVPAGATTGYDDIDSYDDDDSSHKNWGNGFRGGGWKNSHFDGGAVNANISLRFDTYP